MSDKQSDIWPREDIYGEDAHSRDNESFLLMTEWHPRFLHFPPRSDGWDVALLAPDAPDVSEGLEPEENLALYRWREEVCQNQSAVLS